MIESYVRQNDDGILPNLSSIELLSALTKLKTIDDIRTQEGRTTTEADVNIEGFDGFIFTNLMSEPLVTPYEGYAWISLSFGKAAEKQMDAKIEVLIVNPHSKHLNEALRFISCFTDASINTTVYYAVHPSIMKPYENPVYEQSIAQSKKEVETITAQLKSCTLEQHDQLIEQLQNA